MSMFIQKVGDDMENNIILVLGIIDIFIIMYDFYLFFQLCM
jgi:hypothetical protein